MRSFHGQTGRLERPACLLKGKKSITNLNSRKWANTPAIYGAPDLVTTTLSIGKIGHRLLFFFYLSFSQKRLKISNDFELFCSSKIPYKIKLKKKLNGNVRRVKAQKHLDTNPNMHNVSNLTGLVLVMFNSKSRHSAQGNTHLTDEFQSPLWGSLIN